jgi:YtoQ family protein
MSRNPRTGPGVDVRDGSIECIPSCASSSTCRSSTSQPHTDLMTTLSIYLAGEIHSDWRDQLRNALADRGVDAEFLGPQENHDRSDDIGELILGEQPDDRYRDLMGASVNTLRTRVHMGMADVVVACFTEKYRQWNTASDAGAAVASGVPLILVRPRDFIHALKELDAQADLTVETLDQAAQAIAYIVE